MTGVDRIKDFVTFVPQRITALPESLQANHQRYARLITGLDQLLEGTEYSFVGSTSLFLGMGEKYQRPIHDIDIVVHRQDIEKIRRAFQENGYDFWDENFIHRSVRNLTGGKGRHHNYGASLPQHLHNAGFPIWIGLFFYEEEGDYLIFTEYLAVSERKVRLMLRNLLDKVESARLRQLEEFLGGELDTNRVGELIEYLVSSGRDFWTEINLPEINNLDLKCRDTYRAIEKRYQVTRNPEEKKRWQDYVEHYFEFRLVTRYPISAQEYLFSRLATLPAGRRAYIVPLEISYLIFSEFYPHYLGERAKYRESALILKNSGNLDSERLAFFRKIFEGREEIYELVGEFSFEMGADKTLDPKILNGINENGKRVLKAGEPNYLTLQLERVHYRTA